jgi:DNA topoisomerase VI subunit B
MKARKPKRKYRAKPGEGKLQVRTPLRTSRLLDFFSEKELTAQTGNPKPDWPLVGLKELVDNGVDHCEEAGIAPQIAVLVDQDGITVTDNGFGIPPESVTDILDFSVRVSSREHIVAPTRGTQGNALKTVVVMPFVLDGDAGRVEISAQGIRHDIWIALDRIKQEPKIDHQQHCDPLVKNGTRIKLYWPLSASSILESARARFLQLASDFTFLNPHLTLTVDWFGERRLAVQATTTDWPKWLPHHPISAHWPTSLDRLVASYISDDESKGQDRTVRALLGEFAGLSSTAKQKAVLEATGLARMNLSALRNGDGLDTLKVSELHRAMKANSRPIQPAALGMIGRDHVEARFQALGCEMETFRYRKVEGDKDGLPWVLETAFAATAAAFGPGGLRGRRIVTGVNWSPSVAANPFRQLGHESLDSILQDQRAGHNEPVVFLLHLACPRVSYTDRGKSAVVIAAPGGGNEEDE